MIWMGRKEWNALYKIFKKIERHEIMSISMWILMAVMCIVGIGSTVYIVGSMVYYLAWKIWRKIKNGTPLYD